MSDKRIKTLIADTFLEVADALETGQYGKKPVIGFASEGSEHGEDNIKRAMELAAYKGLDARLIEGEDIHKEMEKLLDSGEIDAAVTMHYPFPIGVSTVGKVITPGIGKPMYLATTTVFELVMLEKSFAASVKEKLAAQNLLKEDQLAALDKNSENDDAKIASLVNDEHAEPLYFEHKLVGAVKRAHDVDVNLSAHVMLENLVTKASNVLSLIELVKKAGVNPDEVDYVIDCCEEACGDMNQRGGGNFAKAAAEIAGYTNATGSDVRGFCAGPAHAMLHAAALVKAGTFKNVVVTAGGCTAKLGMNGKDHVKKGLPILEDAIAGFSVLVSADDGVSPQIRTDIIGRHTIGTGSAPQNVIGSLVADPLERAGLLMTDIDKYSPEMQNPDITKPAGAGDVPEANYKMIAALAVKKGQIARTDIANFVKEHGMTGWAPTQGHIPSGVPYIGPLREEVLAGETKRAMIIGKGSLFLGRMTNLFDGVSFVVQANDGSAANGGEAGFDEAKVKAMIGQAMREFANGLLGSEE